MSEREIETLSGRELLDLLEPKKPSAPRRLSSQERSLWNRVDDAPLEFVIAARHRVDADRRKAVDALGRVDGALNEKWTTLPDPPNLSANVLKRRAQAKLTDAALDIRHHHKIGARRPWQEKRYGVFLIEHGKVLNRVLKAIDEAAALPGPKYLPDTSLVVEDGTFSAAFHEELARIRTLVAAEIAAHDARVKDWADRVEREAERFQPFDEKAAVTHWLARCRDISPSVTWSIASDLLWLLTGEDVKPDTVRNRLART